METKKKIAFGMGGLVMVGMISSMVMEMVNVPTPRKPIATVVTPSAPVIVAAKAASMQGQTLILELSDNASDIITALDSSYLSTIKTQAISAEILEIEEQKILDKLKDAALYGEYPSAPVVIAQPTTATPSVIDRLQIKSIIANPNSMTAFIEISGQLIPVKKGGAIEGLNIHDISRNAVVFKRGNKLVTKYINAAPIKVVIEKENGDVGSQ